MTMTAAQANTPIRVTYSAGDLARSVELCDPTSSTNWKYGQLENAVRGEVGKLGDLSGTGAVTKDVGDVLRVLTFDGKLHDFPLQAPKVPDAVRALVGLLR
jgi:hypothetical protein